MAGYYKSKDEIEAVVMGFESCTTDKTQFPHQRHLTVAVWYLSYLPFDAAAERMRAGLFRFLDYNGVSRQKYNETLTIFWMKAICVAMDDLSSNLSILEVTNSVVESLGDSRLAFQYYSSELVNSDRARSEWVEPDLKALNATTCGKLRKKET